MGTAIDLRPQQIALVKHTIARDCNDSEFDLFMEAAKSYGLDPFRKQIIPLVFSKDNPDKRRMSIVVARDGLRVIAQRCGNYRPASEPAQIDSDPGLKSPTNPLGIVRAVVRLWQQDNRGEWFPVMGEAYWDEFAPVAEEWAWNDEKGKRLPTGKKTLDPSGNWARMPRVMITKCAEAQALRAGWPDQFGGVYAEEELDRAKVIDMTASQIAGAEEERRRMERIGGEKSVMLTWGDGWKLESVPLGQMVDRCAEFIRDSDAATVKRWADANAEPLRQFWAMAPNDALEIKRQVEAKTSKGANAA